MGDLKNVSMKMEYYDGYSGYLKNFIDCSNVSYSLPEITGRNTSKYFLCPERIDEMSFNKTANNIREIFGVADCNVEMLLRHHRM